MSTFRTNRFRAAMQIGIARQRLEKPLPLFREAGRLQVAMGAQNPFNPVIPFHAAVALI